jgi:hypothetical protein
MTFYKGQQVRIKGLPLFSTDPDPGTLADVARFHLGFVIVRHACGESSYLPEELEAAS